MSFGGSHLAVGDPLGDRFWLSPKKGESVAVGCSGRRVSPEADVCMRRGCGHVAGSSCATTAAGRAPHREKVLRNGRQRTFFFLFSFPFRSSLEPRDSRRLRIPKLWLYCLVAFWHRSFSRGMERGSGGLFQIVRPVLTAAGEISQHNESPAPPSSTSARAKN